MLDGLRAAAVSLVILYHSHLPVNGGLGVLIFFVISGFLITWLLLKEHDKYGKISVRRFYLRRSLKIFPAFYVYAALMLLYTFVRHRHVLWSQVVASLFYFNNYYQAILGDPNTGFSHTWSLGVEEQFYLFWPVAFWIWKDRPFTLKRVLLTSILAIWVYRAVLQFGFHVHQGYFYAALDTRADHLLIGCLLAVVLWTDRSCNRLQRFCAPWQLGLTAFALFASAMLEARYGSGYRDSLGFMIDPVLVALLIIQLIACRDLRAIAWLQSAPVRYLGTISYSLYLYQQLVLPIVEKALGSYPVAVRVLASCVAVIGVASASFYIIERPFLRLKHRFEPGTKAITSIEAATYVQTV